MHLPDRVLQLPSGLDATELQMQHSLKTRFRYTEKLTDHTHDKPILQPRVITHLTGCNRTVILQRRVIIT